jgi:GTP diphosphokinase / guanosine-3',5'-bis(diphosphate) 3'-diphosphatase
MLMTVAEDGGPETARDAALDESRDAHGREVKMPKAKDDLGLVLRAAQFAAQKHKDQRRKDVKATPYINHPINLAEVLHTDGGVHDPIVIAAALLHDTIEDTETTYDELRGVFGTCVADVVIEVTDVKFLADESRKRLQVAKAGRASERARQVKLADKICNLRDILAGPPAGWSLARQQKYFDWAKEVVDQARGVNPKLERMFDRLYRQRPVG